MARILCFLFNHELRYAWSKSQMVLCFILPNAYYYSNTNFTTKEKIDPMFLKTRGSFN